jgi:hypothetical protein
MHLSSSPSIVRDTPGDSGGAGGTGGIAKLVRNQAKIGSEMARKYDSFAICLNCTRETAWDSYSGRRRFFRAESSATLSSAGVSDRGGVGGVGKAEWSGIGDGSGAETTEWKEEAPVTVCESEWPPRMLSEEEGVVDSEGRGTFVCNDTAAARDMPLERTSLGDGGGWTGGGEDE